MLTEKGVVGKKTDWANYITLSDEHETPLLRSIPKGEKPVNVVKNYQADVYQDPKPNNWPDGKDWDAFKSAGQGRKPLAARVQWFVQTAAVSKLAEDVADTAGLNSELATEIPKKLTEMAREMECSAACDQISAADAGDEKNGNRFRGIGAWVNSAPTADADVAIDATIRTPAASIYSDTKGNLTEDAIKSVLESQWKKTGSKSMKSGFVGSKLKKQFGAFQFYIPTSLNTQATARIMTRDGDATVLGNMVDVYDSDWGKVELTLTNWNMHPNFIAGASATKTDWYGWFLNLPMWSWNWNQKPTVYKPEFKGGSYKAAMDAILMLLCKTPIGEMAIKPNDA